jgi:hypothetical protein
MKKVFSIIMLSVFLIIQTQSISAMRRHEESCCTKVMRALKPTRVLVGAALLVAYLSEEIQPTTAEITSPITTTTNYTIDVLACYDSYDGAENFGYSYLSKIKEQSGNENFKLEIEGLRPIFFKASRAGCYRAVALFAEKSNLVNLVHAQQVLFKICPPFKEVYKNYTQIHEDL